MADRGVDRDRGSRAAPHDNTEKGVNKSDAPIGILGLYDKDSEEVKALWQFFETLANESPDAVMMIGDYVLTPVEIIEYVKKGYTWLWDRIVTEVRRRAIREKTTPERALMGWIRPAPRLTPELEAAYVRAGLKRKIDEEAKIDMTEEIRKEILKAIEETKDKHERASYLVKAILLSYQHVMSPRNKHTDKIVGTYCWDGKRWFLCEELLIGEAHKIMESLGFGFEARWTPSFEAEFRKKLIRKTQTEEPEIDPLAISFENTVLDWGELRGKNIDAAFKKHDPKLWIFNHIPWNLDIDILREAIEKDNIEELFKKHAPEAYKAFRDWVDDKWILLLEVIGYTLYPRYDLHKAIMLVGEGSNGKSVFLRLLVDILGPENVASLSLQELADISNRFAAADLHRKLANIYPDLPDDPLKSVGRFKALTGQDRICADRKFRDRICFTNYAKLIFAANRLPAVSEDTYAFFRRWLAINYPRQFPLDSTFYERTFTKRAKEVIIALSIAAFLKVLRRESFSFEGTAEDYKEVWLRNSNPVYNFVTTMIERGKLRKDPNARISTDMLWGMYIEFCREEEIEPIQRNTFTMELEKLGFQRVKVQGKYYYKGLARVEDESRDLTQHIGQA